MNIMEIVIGALLGALLGGAVAYLVSRRLYSEQSRGRQVIVVKSGVPASVLSDDLRQAILREAHQKYPNESFSEWQQCHFVVASVGTEPITALKIAVFAEMPAQVMGWKLGTDKNLISKRLEVIEEPPVRLMCLLSFLNPGEMLIISAIINGTEDPRKVYFEADGEQLHVRYYSSAEKLPPRDVRKLGGKVA